MSGFGIRGSLCLKVETENIFFLFIDTYIYI